LNNPIISRLKSSIGEDLVSVMHQRFTCIPDLRGQSTSACDHCFSYKQLTSYDWKFMDLLLKESVF